MKKLIIICLLSVMALFASACSDKPETEDTSKEQSIAGPSEPSAEESSRDEKELLNDSFGRLFESDEYYIRASITVASGLSGSEENSYELTVEMHKNVI